MDREKRLDVVWRPYGRAVQGLRSDLQSSERCLLPETLCTAELLGFVEVSIASENMVLFSTSYSTVC